MKRISSFLVSLFTLILCTNPSIAQTTLQKIDSTWQILVDGERFPIKGVTFGYDKDPDNFDTYFEELKSLGVNSIRTWGTGETTPKLMDSAHKFGIKVMLGIWMRHGRPGMEADDSFNYLEDEDGKADMFEYAMETVNQYKNHPALLTWGVGNEVYLNIATEEEKLEYSKFLEKVCSKIKELDPNHPITSVEAWTFGMDWWSEYVPSVDIYGLNVYGGGASILANELKKRDIDKPYVITEFGVRGEWDIQEDANGVKIEPSDQEKYDTIVNGYRDWVKEEPMALGLYVFHYGDEEMFGAPWLLTRYQGKLRPAYWAIREAYMDKKPINSIPEIKKFSLPEGQFKSGNWIPVALEVEDQENENLAISFAYNQRTGSRKRRDQITSLDFSGNIKDGYQIKLPAEQGGIKVYVLVDDEFGNRGVSTASIFVTDKQAAQKKFLVPKAELPFYVYKDGDEIPYFPSGYMGNTSAIKVDLKSTSMVHSGTHALEIHYEAKSGWYGLAFVDPPGDWGDILGGYDISGAKTLSFWARTKYTKVNVSVGYGMIEGDKPYPDTGKKSEQIVINAEWKKYTIKIRRDDMSCIRTGFVLFGSGVSVPHTIYLDDIVFE